MKKDDSKDSVSGGNELVAPKTIRERVALAKQRGKARTGKFFNDYIEGTKLDPYIRKIDDAVGFVGLKKDYKFDNEVVAEASGPIRFGLWLFLVVFVFIGGWSACAKLDSAAIASGVVVVDSSKKTIQHLEGGIIKEILVKDGDKVAAGQVLMKLDETSSKAKAEIVDVQLRAAKAVEARLMAERDGLDKITFGEYIESQRDDPEFAKVIEAQERLFDSRRKAYESKINVLNQKIKQSNEEISGIRAQEHSIREQSKLIKEEADVVEKLVAEGRAVRPRLLALQRKSAELDGQRGEYLALIARAEQVINQSELEIINAKNNYLSEVGNEMKQTQDQIADLEERKKAADDILNRSTIVSQQEGTVMNLRFHTVGGVVQPGTPIMEIIPQNDEQIIEAQVKTQDIDLVHKGLKAKIHLSAYRSRTTPNIEGEVIDVSADRVVDDKSGIPYYKARIKIDHEMMNRLVDHDIKLYPGMPADVFIVTGSRSPLDYMLDPILVGTRHAFKEQ